MTDILRAHDLAPRGGSAPFAVGDRFRSSGGRVVHDCSMRSRIGPFGPFMIGSPCGNYTREDWATKVSGPTTCQKCIAAAKR